MRMRRLGGGFTLVEISVSMLVIGVGFVSLLSVFTVGLKWAQDVTQDSTMMAAVRSAAVTAPAKIAASTASPYDVEAMNYYMTVAYTNSTDKYDLVITCYGSAADRTAASNALSEVKTVCLE